MGTIAPLYLIMLPDDQEQWNIAWSFILFLLFFTFHSQFANAFTIIASV